MEETKRERQGKTHDSIKDDFEKQQEELKKTAEQLVGFVGMCSAQLRAIFAFLGHDS